MFFPETIIIIKHRYQDFFAQQTLPEERLTIARKKINQELDKSVELNIIAYDSHRNCCSYYFYDCNNSSLFWFNISPEGRYKLEEVRMVSTLDRALEAALEEGLKNWNNWKKNLEGLEIIARSPIATQKLLENVWQKLDSYKNQSREALPDRVRDVFVALARNANTPIPILLALGKDYICDFVWNPSLELIILEEPDFFDILIENFLSLNYSPYPWVQKAIERRQEREIEQDN